MGNTKFDRIISDRVILRRFKESDIDIFWEYRANPKISRYQGWENYTKDEAINFVNEQIITEPNISGEWFQMAIELVDIGEMIGDCALHILFDDSRQVEIAYTLSDKYQKQGYATEAIRTLLDYVFIVLKKHRVIARTDVRNDASIKLLERIGMRREGHFLKSIHYKEEWADEFLYAILDEEWLKK